MCNTCGVLALLPTLSLFYDQNTRFCPNGDSIHFQENDATMKSITLYSYYHLYPPKLFKTCGPKSGVFFEHPFD